MRKHRITHIITILLVCLLLTCGLTAFAAEMLYPADVQTVIEDDPSRAGGTRRIVKTYILKADENPNHIPRDEFSRDGWCYTFTDITQERSTGTDTHDHTEKVEINTDSNDLNAILAQLSPTLDYESEDGYCGLITLDLASVKCEAAGYKNSSYTVSASREYPHLSSNDLSLVPKTITDNGKTLELDSVSWEVQHSSNVDNQDIPDSYRAVVKYTAKASKSVVTGYITSAEYSGEITKTIPGDTVYTVSFSGTEINPVPIPVPETSDEHDFIPLIPLLLGIALIAALLAGGGVFFFLCHNVKIFAVDDRGRVMVTKVRISVNNPVIDLTPLTDRVGGEYFTLEINKFAAKSLNGRMITVIFDGARLEHRISYEGNTYRIEADFRTMSIKAIY